MEHGEDTRQLPHDSARSVYPRTGLLRVLRTLFRFSWLILSTYLTTVLINLYVLGSSAVGAANSSHHFSLRSLLSAFLLPGFLYKPGTPAWEYVAFFAILAMLIIGAGLSAKDYARERRALSAERRHAIVSVLKNSTVIPIVSGVLIVFAVLLVQHFSSFTGVSVRIPVREDAVSNLPSWITALAYAVIATAGIAVFFLEWRHFHNETLQQSKEFSQSQEKLSIERRRLTEANVAVQHMVRLIQAPNDPPFIVFQTELTNIGDGPVDMWAALVSARMLSDEFRRGLGRRARDVTWSDYKPFYWNDTSPAALFSGISTTKNMIASPKHFLRFVARESSSLRRIDGVNTPQVLPQTMPLYLMYRLFIVLRGYPLGEILRQVGGTIPDPLLTVPSEQLQFRTLAEPDYGIWQHIQEALSNLIRLAFRLAISPEKPMINQEPSTTDEKDPLSSQDPLGKIGEPDAWRFFLLHHEDFRGRCCKSMDGKDVTMEEFTDEMVTEKFGGQLPEDIIEHSKYEEARTYCREHLSSMVESWEQLLRVIKECDDYQSQGYKGVIKNRVPAAVENFAKDGYSERIHTDPLYREKWLKLLSEGYLLSRPLPRKQLQEKNDSKALNDNKALYDAEDIPADPRYLEPYVMRTFYFLETVAPDGAGKLSLSASSRLPTLEDE